MCFDTEYKLGFTKLDSKTKNLSIDREKFIIESKLLLFGFISSKPVTYFVKEFFSFRYAAVFFMKLRAQALIDTRQIFNNFSCIEFSRLKTIFASTKQHS